ncbi:MAG: putative permease [Rhodobacteraceae bacterium HLUCCA08]|nr:MAG: putative permease [Rhodobacteraceae bacterium HLUCCA08]
MGTILGITLPIYVVVALGYVTTRRGLFDPADLQVMGRYVLNIALPALLFHATASRDIAQILHPGYMVAMAGAGLVTAALTYAWFSATGADPTRRAAGVMGATCPNSAFVGYPVMLLAFPDQAGLVLALNTTVENLLIIPLSLVLFELSKPDAGGSLGRKVAKALAGVLARPYMIGLLAGLAWSLAGLPLPEAADRTLGILGASAAALSLFVIGGTLSGLSLEGNRPAALQTALAKLLLHPAIMALMVLLVPLAGLALSPEMATIAILSAAMPIFGIYTILAQDIGRQGMAALAITLTTLGGFATISAALWLLL